MLKAAQEKSIKLVDFRDLVKCTRELAATNAKHESQSIVARLARVIGQWLLNGDLKVIRQSGTANNRLCRRLLR